MAVLVLATACRQEDDDAAASGSTSDATDATLSATAASSDAPADSGPGDDASTGEPPDDTGSDTDGGGEVEHGDPFVLWDGGGGATREYFNAEAALAWRHWLGDWRDAEGVDQGDAPIATIEIADEDEQRVVEIDLSATIDVGRNWASGSGMRCTVSPLRWTVVGPS